MAAVPPNAKQGASGEVYYGFIYPATVIVDPFVAGVNNLPFDAAYSPGAWTNGYTPQAGDTYQQGSPGDTEGVAVTQVQKYQLP